MRKASITNYKNFKPEEFLNKVDEIMKIVEITL